MIIVWVSELMRQEKKKQRKSVMWKHMLRILLIPRVQRRLLQSSVLINERSRKIMVERYTGRFKAAKDR